MNCALLCKLLDELRLEFSFGNGKKKARKWAMYVCCIKRKGIAITGLNSTIYHYVAVLLRTFQRCFRS